MHRHKPKSIIHRNLHQHLRLGSRAALANLIIACDRFAKPALVSIETVKRVHDDASRWLSRQGSELSTARKVFNPR